MSVAFRIVVFEKIFLSQTVKMHEQDTVTFFKKSFGGLIPKVER